MTTINVPQPPPVKSRRRWRRWAVIAALVAVTLGGILVFIYFQFFAGRDLREAVAEADRLDPGWRVEDPDTGRAVVPDAENGAPIVLAARALMPPGWPTPPVDEQPSLLDRLADLPLRQRVNDADRQEASAELVKVQVAIAKARELADRPHGRYRVAWSEDRIGTPMPHVDALHRIRSILSLDVIMRADRGDIDGAVRSCQAILNSGRSLGDEPAAMSQFVRAMWAMVAARHLERTLAMGTASPAALEKMQHLLEDETKHPHMLIASRAARMDFYHFLEMMRTGRFNRAAWKIKSSTLGPQADDWIDRGRAQACIAAHLRYWTAVVEIAKQPSATQEEALQALLKPTAPLPPLLEGLTRGGEDWSKSAWTFNRSHAEAGCAAAALAAERYRLAENRWPNSLDALVPRYLEAVPTDPFDGRPLRLRRLPDGLIIYSVGPDRVDDLGKLNRQEPGAPGSDIGFQLWDADTRTARKRP
jgi:hypothetical protein